MTRDIIVTTKAATMSRTTDTPVTTTTTAAQMTTGAIKNESGEVRLIAKSTLLTIRGANISSFSADPAQRALPSPHVIFLGLDPDFTEQDVSHNSNFARIQSDMISLCSCKSSFKTKAAPSKASQSFVIGIQALATSQNCPHSCPNEMSSLDF